MDSILLMGDRFSKMMYFLACKKIMDATMIAHLYFKKIVRLDGALRSITSNHDIKFMSYFKRSI